MGGKVGSVMPDGNKLWIKSLGSGNPDGNGSPDGREIEGREMGVGKVMGVGSVIGIEQNSPVGSRSDRSGGSNPEEA